MAKGNLILGTAKNSVGDVVMYRREGAQITRVRVRNVKNPKTNAQSFQRAIMAPIAKFYSPLSVVLERSFEGLSKAKSHNKFNQVNAGLARKNKWALPKGTGFFPLPYVLSQGILPSLTYYVEGSLTMQTPGLTAENATIGGLSTSLATLGLKDGDVITIIVVGSTSTGGDVFSYVPKTVQFVVDSTSTKTFAEAFGSAWSVAVAGGAIEIKTTDGSTIKAGAIIAARFDGNMWRRNTQTLAVDAELMTKITADAAVAAAVASYGMSAGDVNPIVYLDGDELADGQ